MRKSKGLANRNIARGYHKLRNVNQQQFTRLRLVVVAGVPPSQAASMSHRYVWRQIPFLLYHLFNGQSVVDHRHFTIDVTKHEGWITCWKDIVIGEQPTLLFLGDGLPPPVAFAKSVTARRAKQSAASIFFVRQIHFAGSIWRVCFVGSA